MSTTPDQTRPVIVKPEWLDLQNNPFFLANSFQRNEGVEDFLRRRAEHPMFHWNATVRRLTQGEETTLTYAIVHTPATCSVWAPEIQMAVPAYGLQSRDNPDTLLIIPQFLVENGNYELEG